MRVRFGGTSTRPVIVSTAMALLLVFVVGFAARAARAETAVPAESIHAKSTADSADWVTEPADGTDAASGNGSATDEADAEASDNDSGSRGRAAPEEPWRESWSGAEMAGAARSLYSGFAFAPFGSLAEDGWRVRLVSGYGQYPQVCVVAAGQLAPCAGRGTFADLLLGYQHGAGPLTIKAWLGIAMVGQLDTFARDFVPAETAFHTGIGAKAALETWLNVGDNAWAALDLSASSALWSWGGKLRVGYRLWPWLSVGAEAAALGHAGVDGGRGLANARLGLLARFEWQQGEVSAAAGFAESGGNTAQPYATVNWLNRF